MSNRITPAWLRPAAVVLVGLVHAGVVIGAPWPSPPNFAITAPLSIEVVPEGRTATAIEAPKEVQVAEVDALNVPASDSPASEARAVDPPETTKPVPTEKSEHAVQAEEQTASPVEATTQAVSEIKAAEQVTAAEPRKPPLPRAKPKRTTKKHERRDKKEAAKSAASRARARARAVAHSRAHTVTGAAARANYRSLVAAELNRRKFYPPAARASGARGTVVVTFTIGASGRVTRHSIARSSGHAALDRAAHHMMAVMSLPPPPGGVFRATVPIRFDFAR